jgi:hypothetical protein
MASPLNVTVAIVANQKMLTASLARQFIAECLAVCGGLLVLRTPRL